MIKKILLLLFSVSLFAAENKNCTCNTIELSTTEKVVVAGVLGTGVIIAAPYVLPASVLAAIAATSTVAKAAAVAASVKVGAALASTTVVGKVGLGLAAVQLARPLVLQTTEEKLNALLKEKTSRPAKAKTEFISCLKANKDSQINSSGRPIACEDAALFYAFTVGVPELNRRTKAFNNGKCFCS